MAINQDHGLFEVLLALGFGQMIGLGACLSGEPAPSVLSGYSAALGLALGVRAIQGKILQRLGEQVKSGVGGLNFSPSNRTREREEALLYSGGLRQSHHFF